MSDINDCVIHGSAWCTCEKPDSLHQKREGELAEALRNLARLKCGECGCHKLFCECKPTGPTSELEARISTLEKERTSLERRVGELERVLKPLAEMWNRSLKTRPDFSELETDVEVHLWIRVGDIRKAAAALASTPREGTEEPPK